MDSDDFLNSLPPIIDLRSEDRWGAIEELLDHLVECNKLKPEHRNAIAATVEQREVCMSTGVGSGVGLPHASTNLVSEVVGAIGRSQMGIQFNAPDNKRVKLVVLFLVPAGQFQKHTKTVANLVKLIHNEHFRRRFLE